ncbi:dihydrolipoyl dehydrogenase [Metabacillus sp. RGM 3146]|uniref:dihydrolipoyl dehydrogenase n=1 Tax=Metabacillus sp. RGM 3146 TaxID=3401092 RepID=UPI003B9DB0C9
MVVGELALERDLVIIGGGPAGYTAAIRAAQLGKEVTLIEKELLGGICLNKGCIPSKVLSHVSAKYNEISKFKSYGIEVSEVSHNFKATKEYMRKTVENLRKGVEFLCKENKIEVIKGSASFMTEERIGVENRDQFDIYKYRSVLIASGAAIQKDGFKQERILNARTLYDLPELPEELIVYGNDYIAIEAAFSYRNLGANVTVVLEKGLTELDAAIEKELHRLLKKAKIQVKKNMSLESEEETACGIQAVFRDAAGGEAILEGSHLYIQSGLRPALEDLGADRIGLELDDEGFISVDSECRTSLPGIWAAGDITGGSQLAVKAIKQGKTAAESIAGMKPECDLTLLPKVIHSNPPIAAAGLTEEEAILLGHNVKTGQFSLAGNGFTAIKSEKDGLMKVVSDADTDLILGIHMMGQGAVELISSGVTAMEMAAREEDLKFPLYPHPSMNEALLEAVEALTGQAIHQVPKKTPAAMTK